MLIKEPKHGSKYWSIQDKKIELRQWTAQVEDIIAFQNKNYFTSAAAARKALNSMEVS